MRQWWNLAARITGNDYDAEDVAQTVFIRLLSARRFRRNPSGNGQNPGAYLRRAAVREAISLLRWRKRKANAADFQKAKHAGPEFTDNGARPDLQYEVDTPRLDAALEQFEPEVVEMLLMHFATATAMRK